MARCIATYKTDDTLLKNWLPDLGDFVFLEVSRANSKVIDYLSEHVKVGQPDEVATWANELIEDSREIFCISNNAMFEGSSPFWLNLDYSIRERTLKSFYDTTCPKIEAIVNEDPEVVVFACSTVDYQEVALEIMNQFSLIPAIVSHHKYLRAVPLGE